MTRTFRAALVAGSLSIAGLSAVPISAHATTPSPSPSASPTGSPGPVSVPGCTQKYGVTSPSTDSWAATEPIERTFGDGTPATKNCFSVHVDKHTNIQDHERVTVRWSGAHPTAGRSIDPFGENGLPQEYPVLIMECRGVDPKDGTVGGKQEAVSPDTCWTNTFFQRTVSATPDEGIWQADASASPGDTGHISGIDPSKLPNSCNISQGSDYHVTPYLAANGKLYPACSSETMPPEAAANSVSIPNEVAAFTDEAGKGSVAFEARTNLDNASMGCSSTVPCTLEVIPIDGINCADPDPSAPCNSSGVLPEGQINPGQAPADAVAPAFWWSASNWDRRVPVPLAFAPPPTVCSLAASSGKPVPFFGSELLSQAALQWTPAYCLNKKRFDWQDNIQPDDGAFSLMIHGDAAAAEVSGRRSGDSAVDYAPTALTGWAIAFDIDKPNQAGQQISLKLNARLLAKLLTESYPGSLQVLQQHPGLSHNPVSMNLDPEFEKLNPGLDTSHWSEAASALMSLSTSSDVIEQLTSYIAADPQAMAFIHGKPDPWGMRVNPFYKNIKLPVSTWPLLDTWVNKTTSNPCLGAAQTAYMPLVASPLSNLRIIATDLLNNWPSVSTGCTGGGTADAPYQLGRVAPEGLGSRFFLGLVTLGDARRYGLTVASLQAAPGHFVAPSDAGIKAAVSLAKSAPNLRPLQISQAAFRKSKTAYPGTMVVYTAARTSGLPKATAADVAQFIRISSTQGQTPGRGNGQLPDGYLPITKSGATNRLYVQAQRVAAAVAAQKGPANVVGTPTSPSTGGAPGGAGGGAGGGLPTTRTGAPSGQKPEVVPSGYGPAPSPPRTVTAALSSQVAGSLLPWLLVAGVLAGLATAGSQLWLRQRGLK